MTGSLSPRPQNSNHLYGGFNFVPKAGRKDRPERSAWPIREYTIRKIIKTEFVNTSFYRFLLLRIEEESPRPQNSNHLYGGFNFVFGAKFGFDTSHCETMSRFDYE